MILFKAKAFLDLKQRRDSGEPVDSSDIKKHKKDILRIAAEIMLEKVSDLPSTVKTDIEAFIDSLTHDPFDSNSLKNYGLKNEDLIEALQKIYN